MDTCLGEMKDDSIRDTGVTTSVTVDQGGSGSENTTNETIGAKDVSVPTGIEPLSAVVISHPFHDESQTTMIRYDSQNTVLDYARSNERPWKRSLDKFVRDHVLSTKPAAISGADSPVATASREQKLDPEQSVDDDVPEAAMTPHLSLTIALDDARSILSQCQHVLDYRQRQIDRANRRATRFPYDPIAISIVFSYLDARSLMRSTQVCKQWRDCAYEDLLQCWETLLRVDFGVSAESVRMNQLRRAQLEEETRLRDERQRLSEERRRAKEERIRRRKELAAAAAAAATAAAAAALATIAPAASSNDSDGVASTDVAVNPSESPVGTEPAEVPTPPPTPVIEVRDDDDTGNRAEVVRERKRYVVETLSTPTAAAVEDEIEVEVSVPLAAAATAVSSSEQSATKVEAPGAGDVPFPPSYFSNARSRWAKDMYHDMWRSYRQLVFGDSGFRSPPVVPLHLLRQSAPTSLFAPGFF